MKIGFLFRNTKLTQIKLKINQSFMASFAILHQLIYQLILVKAFSFVHSILIVIKFALETEKMPSAICTYMNTSKKFNIN